MHSGTVPRLLTGRGDSNWISLYVDGPYGWVYVNGEKVLDEEGIPIPVYGTGIDLGGELRASHGGGVAVVTGTREGSERSGAVTSYEQFQGRTYDHGR